ncbi:MAG: aminoglycoside phosphotransferase family protein [Lentisphaeria bacterium]|nr:aminoglycoside phosphotransferase family protein [Lentisphaeria bacterium]
MAIPGNACHRLADVVPRFCVEGAFVDARPYGSGHINDTYLVRTDRAGRLVPWITQRINHGIFQDVPGLMENICRVTEHLRAGLAAVPAADPDRETLTVIPTRDGMPYHRDDNGDFWRTYIFIAGATTHDQVAGPAMAYEAAKAFGSFQSRLRDLPDPPLRETIPRFHHTPSRFARLEHAIRADARNRAASCADDIAFALSRGAMAETLVAAIDAGDLPLRVTHNDTKINNVMIDDRDGHGVCVIDLDTVMPGTVLYDFGDQVRTATATAAEDEGDLGRVSFRLDLFEALVHGYLDAAREFLVDAEIGFLAFSGRLITFEIGVRFLTDYLDGDAYFKTHRPGHNLDRARTQFEMVRQMEENAERMEQVVARHR